MRSWSDIEGINDADEEIDDAFENCYYDEKSGQFFENCYYDEKSGQFIDNTSIVELIGKEILSELERS